MNKYTITQEIKDSIISDYNDLHLGCLRISRKYGIHPSSINFYLRKWGVKQRKFCGDYKGSNHWNNKGGSPNNCGYLQTSKSKTIHRLVYESANGKIPDGMDIHHINGIKTDNRIENLIAVTKEEHRKIHDKKNVDKIIKEYNAMQAIAEGIFFPEEAAALTLRLQYMGLDEIVSALGKTKAAIHANLCRAYKRLRKWHGERTVTIGRHTFFKRKN